MEMKLTWEHGYRLMRNVYKIDDVPFIAITSIPVTAIHMGITESYPCTYDSVMGNYE